MSVEDTSLRDAVAQWQLSLELEGVTSASRTSYRSHLLDLAADLESALERAALLADCTRPQLRSCLLTYQQRPDRRRGPETELAERPRARRSVEARLTAFRSFFRWCVREELLAVDPTRLLTLEAPPAPPAPALLSLDDARLLREAAASSRQPERDLLVLALTLGAGCSVGELAALRREDLDLAAGTLTLTSKRTRAGVRTRTLRCSPATLDALRAYLPRRDARLARLGTSSEFLVLTGSEELSTRTRSLARHLERLATRCGLEASSHTLRASFAVLALEAGSSVREVQATLGVSLHALRAMLPLPRDVPVGVSAHPWG